MREPWPAVTTFADWSTNETYTWEMILSDVHHARAHELADTRNGRKKLDGVREQRATQKLNDWQANYVGAMGELGIHEYTGIEPDREYSRGGDRGIDFTIDGVTYDAKCTTFPYGGLLFKPPAERYFVADWAIHTELRCRDRKDPTTATKLLIRGVISRGEFLANPLPALWSTIGSITCGAWLIKPITSRLTPRPGISLEVDAPRLL